MPERRVIAILDRSAGNSETGEAWQETAGFDSKASLLDVLRWAAERHGDRLPEYFKGRLQLTIEQCPDTNTKTL